MSSFSESTQASLSKVEQANGVASLAERINQLSQQVLQKETVLLGEHLEFQKTLRLVEQFAQSEEPVLITGESGVGKELFARALYLLNGRQGSPFVSVNCGQFSDEQLMVSELFGHTKGSFTGAVEDRRGVFETANGGAILLDEIGELSASAQKMLLRVIDQKEVRPVGSNKIRSVDIRVISATHCNLSHLVEEGKFREDLFFRLSCLHLHVPALPKEGKTAFCCCNIISTN
ncbi:sigma-54 factor interaction domain-containing protein [candidate division KSB1 bacterium]|nr:sigma-54 factor interaction domain-containing protein [candidate division KSB1 bacterium]